MGPPAKVLAPIGKAVHKVKHEAAERMGGTPKQQQGESDSSKSCRKDNFLPILIFPGFMSSGLICQHSKFSSWQGRRVWLNIAAAGFDSLHSGGALRDNAEKKRLGQDYDSTLDKEYNKEVECKSKWLQHMVLSDDMVNEVNDIQVRPLSGLSAVDYLVPGNAISNHISWVFAPVIKALQDAGYTNVNLDAAPYDWRVPPSVLESRDSYFTKTMQQVEHMYESNNHKAVVLLCHSMGCRCAHYFLNFALQTKGQTWLDTYIHTYVPVGAPHLGATKAIRGCITGDKMGLEAFLSNEESLVMGRALSSPIWLFPRVLPSYTPPAVVMRREGTIKLKVQPFEISSLLENRDKDDSTVPPPKVRLAITFGSHTVNSEWKIVPDGTIAHFEEEFSFPAPPTLASVTDTVVVRLEEPGMHIAKREKISGPFEKYVLSPMHKSIDCMVCSVRAFLPCLYVKEVVTAGADVALAAADTVAAALGTASTLAVSEPMDMGILAKRNPSQFMVKLTHVKDNRRRKAANCCMNSGKFRSEGVILRVEWHKPNVDIPVAQDAQVSPVATPSNGKFISSVTPDLHLQCSSNSTNNVLSRTMAKSKQAGTAATQDNPVVEYKSVEGRILYRSEGIWRFKKVMQEYYDPDPLGPRTTCASDAPPVKRVKAIYGINLDTECGAVFRQRAYTEVEGKILARQELDLDATMQKEGYVLKGGLIFETKDSPQVMEYTNKKEMLKASGDGTVPYWSLAQSKLWKDECNVEIHELEGAEHRDILKDERFHKILLDYVTL